MGNLNDPKTEPEEKECSEPAETADEEPSEETAKEEVSEEVSEEDADRSNILEEDEDLSEDNKPKERKLNWAKKAGFKKESIEEKLKTQIAEVNDKYARLFAEFDNFRKRSEKEKIARYDMGARDVIEKILPIIDNFERGFDTVEESDKEDAFVTGMDLVYKQFCKILEDMGVKPIEAVGKEFDPELHNAVMHVDDPEVGENIVVEEFQKGYMYKDQVVRYSMVKVAN
jgi:molecular chaperone GrpE